MLNLFLTINDLDTRSDLYLTNFRCNNTRFFMRDKIDGEPWKLLYEKFSMGFFAQTPDLGHSGVWGYENQGFRSFKPFFGARNCYNSDILTR